MRLDNKIFKCVVENTPLISIDIIIKKEDKILLGKRKNKPAKNFYFTTGGRIFKNETINQAINRIAKEELNIKIDKNKLKFIGIFEHFYTDSIFDNISTHYINIAYFYEIENKIELLPLEQHSEYKWFSIEEIMKNDLVHKYVKDYFKGKE